MSYCFLFSMHSTYLHKTVCNVLFDFRVIVFGPFPWFFSSTVSYSRLCSWQSILDLRLGNNFSFDHNLLLANDNFFLLMVFCSSVESCTGFCMYFYSDRFLFLLFQERFFIKNVIYIKIDIFEFWLFSSFLTQLFLL